MLPALARGGDQAYLSWTIDDEAGKPTVTWTITGSTNWYVGVVQIASRPDVNSKGDFLASNLVAYDVLTPAQSKGTWQTSYALGAGTYYGQLVLRYDGPCQSNCESHSSVRSFAIEPPKLDKLTWMAAVRQGRIAVTWSKPGGGWYVGMVLVDDDEDFSSPEDAGIWPVEPAEASWTSAKLDPDTYYVRVHARYAGCETCIWISAAKKVSLPAGNRPPVLRPATVSIVQRDEAALRHTWRATFAVCDHSPGRLTLQVRQETWTASGGPVRARTSSLRLAAPKGCRAYTVVRRSAWPFRSGTFVRVILRVRDGQGAWSARERTMQWFTP